MKMRAARQASTPLTGMVAVVIPQSMLNRGQMRSPDVSCPKGLHRAASLTVAPKQQETARHLYCIYSKCLHVY